MNQSTERTTEENEPNLHRSPDTLQDALETFCGFPFGPHIINMTFRVDIPLTRGMDMTYDRFYPKERLLVHSFARRRKYTDLVDEVIDKEIDEKREFAATAVYQNKVGCSFLAIVDGELERDDLLRLRQELTAMVETVA